MSNKQVYKVYAQYNIHDHTDRLVAIFDERKSAEQYAIELQSVMSMATRIERGSPLNIPTNPTLEYNLESL